MQNTTNKKGAKTMKTFKPSPVQFWAFPRAK